MKEANDMAKYVCSITGLPMTKLLESLKRHCTGYRMGGPAGRLDASLCGAEKVTLKNERAASEERNK